MKSSHLITVKHHYATNHRPSRICLTSEQFAKDKITVPFDYEFPSGFPQAVKLLKDLGYTVVTYGTATIGWFVCVAEFISLAKMRQNKPSNTL